MHFKEKLKSKNKQGPATQDTPSGGGGSGGIDIPICTPSNNGIYPNLDGALCS